jgi:hypothetical protein
VSACTSTNSITVRTGEDIIWPFTFTDDNGDAIDLTGSTVYVAIKRNSADSDSNAVLTDDVTSFTGDDSEIATASWTAAENAAALHVGSYVAGIAYKNSSNIVVQYGEFTVVVERGINQRAAD